MCDTAMATADYMIHSSPTWLLVHELLHYHLGHFELIVQECISEVGGASKLGLVPRVSETQIALHHPLRCCNITGTPLKVS